MIYKNKAFRITMNVIMVLLTLCCILPFILLIASSFSSEADLTKYGYSFIPRGFTLAAYKYIWAIKENILRAYGMSFLITGIGTVINLVMTLLPTHFPEKTFLGGNGFPFSCSLQCFSMVVLFRLT